MRGSGVSLRSDAAKDVDIYQLISNLAGKVEELEAKLESAEAKLASTETELVLHKDKSMELETKLIQLSQDNNATVAEIAEEVFEFHTQVPEELLREAETYTMPPQNVTTAEETIGVQSSVGLKSGDWCLAYTLRRSDTLTGYWSGGVNFESTQQCYWMGDNGSWSKYASLVCRYDASYWRAPASWTNACANCPTPYKWNANRVEDWAFDMGVNYWRTCA